MALAINISDGRGLNNIVGYCQRRARYNAVFAVHYTVKLFNQLYITNSFKSGRAVQVVGHIKEDWPIVLQ